MATPSAFKEAIAKAFAAETPAGVEKVFGPSQTRNIYEDLWQDGGLWKRNFGDLWNERHLWEGRDLLGKGQKPGLETGGEANPEAAAAQTDTGPQAQQADPAQQQLRHIVDSINPQARIHLEQGLNSLLAEPMQRGTVRLDDLADNPQAFMAEYMAKLPPEDRAAFDRRMEEFIQQDTESRARAEATAMVQREDADPSHHALAFLASAIGSEEAGRIHEYLRTRGADGTLAGTYGDNDDEDTAEERARKDIAQQFAINEMINNLNYQIAAIDRELGQIAERIGEIDERVAQIDTRLTQIQEETTRLEEDKTRLEQENAVLEGQEAAVTVQLERTEVQAAAADARLEAAEVRAEEAMAGTLAAQDGNQYAKNADGQYVYVNGPNQGQVVPDDQRAAWWEERWAELQGIGSAQMSAEDIVRAKQEVEAARQQSAEIGQVRDELRGERDELRGRIQENRQELRDINKQLGELGIEARGLTEERSQLLLERNDLTQRQRELLEQRAELVQQRDELRAERDTFYNGEYRSAIETAALNDTLVSHLEQQSTQMEKLAEAQQSWASMAAENVAYNPDGTAMTREEINAQDDATGSCSLRVTEEEFNTIMSDTIRIQQETAQLREVLADVQAGKPVDMSRLPESVREDVVVAGIKSDTNYFRSVDLTSFSPEAQQRIVESAVTARLEAGQRVPVQRFAPEYQQSAARAVVAFEEEGQYKTTLQKYGITEEQWKSGILLEPGNEQIRASIEQDMTAWRDQRTAQLLSPLQHPQQQAAITTPSVVTATSAATADDQGIQNPLGSPLSSSFSAAVTPAQPAAEEPATPAISPAQTIPVDRRFAAAAP